MKGARTNVAFIHTGAWGDLYVSSAALSEVVEEFAGEPIYVVGSEKWLQILNPIDWPTVKGILVTANGRTGTLYLSAQNSWSKKDESLSLIRFFASFKATFNIRTESLRFAWAPFFARVPRRHGSAEFPWSSILYTHAAPWLGKDPEIHERDRMLQVIEAPKKIGTLAAKWKNSTGLPQLKAPDRANAEKLTHAKFKKYWLINPTASRREKAWPSKNFRELYSKLQPKLAQNGIALKILGAPAETEWLKEVLPNGFDEKLEIVQPPKIADLLDVLGGADVLITNTSSVQFLSPGMGVKTITLMGRANPRIWGPLGRNDVLIQGTSSGTTGDIFAEEKMSYETINVERVLQECDRLLSFGLES